MNCVQEVFPGILYILGCILLIALIVLVFRLMQTLSKVDKTIDDINEKSTKLNGVFDLVDKSADAINSISDTAVNFITGAITGFINKKRKNKGGDEEDE